MKLTVPSEEDYEALGGRTLDADEWRVENGLVRIGDEFRVNALGRILDAINDPEQAFEDANLALDGLDDKLEALATVFGLPALVEPQNLVDRARRAINGMHSGAEAKGDRLITDMTGVRQRVEAQLVEVTEERDAANFDLGRALDHIEILHKRAKTRFPKWFASVRGALEAGES